MSEVVIPGCRDDWNGLGEYSPYPVLSPKGSYETRCDFYWPQNWPGNRAPCEWHLDSAGGYVSLWIEYASEPGTFYLDTEPARSVSEAIEADRRLTERRDHQLLELARGRAYCGYRGAGSDRPEGESAANDRPLIPKRKYFIRWSEGGGSTYEAKNRDDAVRMARADFPPPYIVEVQDRGPVEQAEAEARS